MKKPSDGVFRDVLTGRLHNLEPEMQSLRIEQANNFYKDFSLVDLDYLEIEKRIMNFMRDPKAKRPAAPTAHDLYTKVASKFFEIAETEVTKEQRTWVKKHAYHIMYSGETGSDNPEEAILNHLHTFQKVFVEPG